MTTDPPDPAPTTPATSRRDVRPDDPGASGQAADDAQASPTRPVLPAGTRIARVDPDRETVALRRLTGSDVVGARRFALSARASGISLDRLWMTIAEDGEPRQVVLAAPNPGRTAMLWHSAIQRRRDEAGVAALVDHACRHLAAEGFDLAQALLEVRARADRAALERGGLRLLATLDYLERPVPRVGEFAPTTLPPGLAFDTWQPDRAGARSELVTLLEATYESTLDCPGLAGLRRTEDVLDGHLGVGEHRPDWWTLLREDGRAVGAALFNGASAGASIELVYFGLAPLARGRGLGRALLGQALRRLAGARERSVVLAVDRRNDPAQSLYRSFAFRRTLERIALVRPIGNAARSR